MAAPTYHPTSPKILDRTFRDLSVRGQAFMLAVKAFPDRATEGLYVLPAGLAAAHLGWTVDDVQDAMTELERAGLVSYDADVEVVLDRTALHDQRLRANDNRIKHAVRVFADVPATPLKRELFALATTLSPDYAEALAAHDPTLTHTDVAADDATRPHLYPAQLYSPLPSPSKPLPSPSSEACPHCRVSPCWCETTGEDRCVGCGCDDCTPLGSDGLCLACHLDAQAVSS